MTDHTLWSPSALHRRMACPGSANAEFGLVEKPSRESAEGTAMHWIRESCLVQNKQVEDYLGEILEFDGYKFVCDQEWSRAMQPGIDFIRELGGDLYVEVELDLGDWMEGEAGTLDTAVVAKHVLWIIDFKSGRDPVDAVDNEQLLGYALGMWAKLPADVRERISEIVLKIDQPYVYNRGSEWRIDLKTLLAFGERLVAAWVAGQQPDAPRIPSSKACKYCNAADHCRESAAVLLDIFNITEEGSAVIPESERLQADELAAILKNAKLISNALEKYKERAADEIKLGNRVPGYKLVEGSGAREWVSQEAAEEFLSSRFPKDKVFNMKLISPAQAENLLGTRLWAKAQALIVRKDAAPQLVEESDKRPPIVTATELFSDDEELDDLIESDEVEDLDDLDDLI